MIDYNELYELLRKEKYSEQLQVLSKNFITEISDFLLEKKRLLIDSTDSFSEDSLRTKKQFENYISIFRELMRLRKRKILNLVFVASETGIMKRDATTMLSFEKDLFEKIVTNVEFNDKEINRLLKGDQSTKPEQRMVMITQSINEFVGMDGNVIGPFEKGMLVNIDNEVARILVSESRANFVDD